MLKSDLEESVGYWVAMTSHLLRRSMDAELARENITIRQWEVLAWTVIQEDLSQCQLAERMGIEAPTLAGIVARMERDGWLERCACPDDRRKKHIRATARADAVWERMLECCRRVRAKATENVSPEELSQFRATCSKICSNLGTPLNPPPAPAPNSVPTATV